MVRVGIPRALCYYQYFPLLKTLFTELGAEVVTSPPTTKPMLAAGMGCLTAETCIPIKAYFGHVLELRQKVDWVFVPSLRSAELELYNCVKLFALPDMVRGAIKDAPPMLDMLWDVNLGYRALGKEIAGVARRVGASRRRIPGAVRAALAADERYNGLLGGGLTPSQAMRQMGIAPAEDEELSFTPKQPAGLRVALVGHPYVLHDGHANHNLVQRLTGLGVTVVQADLLSKEQQVKGVANVIGDVYWLTEKEITGTAGHYMYSDDVDGVITVSAFGCGPDSVMVDAIQRVARRGGCRPVLSLVIDEHSAEAGLVTRLEAFVDMLRRRGGRRLLPAPVTFYSRRPGPMSNPVLTFPHIGTAHVPVRVLLNRLHIPAVVPPPCSQRSLSLAAQYSPEQACIPYKLTLGNFIEALEQGANTTMLLSGPNNCRFGYYHKLQEQVLRDLGYQFHMALPRIDGRNIDGVVALLKGISGASWKECLITVRLALGVLNDLDAVERKVQWLRPRELTPGAANRIWQDAIERFGKVRDQGELRATKRAMLDRLGAVPIDAQRDPVRVCIVGEIYVVQEPYINQDLEVELGKLGVEANRSEQLSQWISLGPQSLLESIGIGHHARIKKAERGYLDYWSGETLGQTVMAEEDGYDGVIQLAPFTCTPEIVAQNILPKLRAEHDIPVLSLILDEHTARTGVLTRLEAFVDFLNRRRAKRNGRRAFHGVHPGRPGHRP